MGIFRLLLAHAVVFQHLGPFSRHLFIDAGMAVYCFFILSGFFITLVLNTKYKKDTRSFYVNRFMRLWPLYIISVALILIQMWFQGSLPGFVKDVLDLNIFAKILVIFSNTFMLGADLLSHFSFRNGGIAYAQVGISDLHNGTNFLLNYPTWTLSVELLFYLAAPFIVKSVKRTYIFTLIGLAYCIFIKYDQSGFVSANRTDLFYPYYFAYFGLGSLTYFVYRMKKQINMRTYIYGAFIVLLALEAQLRINSFVYILVALATPQLIKLTDNNPLDGFFAELSYPLYILHVPISRLLVQFYPDMEHAKRYVIILAVCILAVYIVERPFTALRRRGFYTLIGKKVRTLA